MKTDVFFFIKLRLQLDFLDAIVSVQYVLVSL